jgi:uncharacterized protein
VALAAARDFPALAHSLYFHLREDFAVPHVALRVWGWTAPAGFARGRAGGRGAAPHAEAMAVPLCGPAGGKSLRRLVRRCRRARALARARAARPGRGVRLLALGSEDPQRFYPEMGTLYLRRIGELCAAGVTARL